MKTVLFDSLMSVAALCLMYSAPAAAQSPVSFTVQLGTTSLSGGDYSAESKATFGVALDVAVVRVGDTQLLVGGDFTRMGLSGADKVVTNPGGFFETLAPNSDYTSGTIGVRHWFGPSVTADVVGGYGSVTADAGATHPAAAWGADVEFGLGGGVHLLIGGRSISWTDRGSAMHAAPVTVGLRFQ